jgi:heme/copper-type cytochrome/quinol oxidase subunit 4
MMFKTWIWLLIIAVLCILLIYVAKKKTKWFGLMLSILFFVVSIFIVVYSKSMTSSYLILFSIFIIANIQTAIQLYIFFKYPEK